MFSGKSSYAESLTWSQINGPESWVITNLIVDPSDSDIIYAGTFWDGVYRSIDKGITWEQINTNLPSGSETYLLSMDSTNPATLYVSTVGYGIFKSINGGERWSSINSGLTNLRVHMAPAIDPTNTSILYAGTEQAVFKSINGGESWTEQNNGLEGYEVGTIAIDPSNPSIIYAGTHVDSWHEGGLFRSSNAGQSWVLVDTGLPAETLGVHFLYWDPTNSKTIYATTEVGVIKSIDGGQNWKSINTGLTNRSVYGISVHPSNSDIIFVGTWGDGVFRTDNGGEIWVSDSVGLTNFVIISVVFDPSNHSTLYAGSYGSGVFKASYVNNSNVDPEDADNDGMPDDWEVANGLDPLKKDASGDKDQDGFSNLSEYKAGTNPNDIKDYPKPIKNKNAMPWVPLLLMDEL